MRQPIQFGKELRKLRIAANLTLTDLANRIHYSKGQLSKVERGLKAPSRDLARLCDAALNAGGALVKLTPAMRPKVTEARATEDADEEVWLMQLSADGQSRFQPMGRRQLLAAGAASIAGMSIGGTETGSKAGSEELLRVSRSLFDQYRQLGQVTNPAILLPALISQTHMLREAAVTTDSATRQGLLKLGSRYAEYVGWLVQETGNEQGALWWTRRAVELAASGGDRHLAAYALVRRALVTLYREDAAQTIGLAQQAQEDQVPPRIRGLAAQREAQGHAISGDYDACMRGLDRAKTLLTSPVEDGDGPVIGTTNLSEPVAMITGWCLHDLGRPREAAEILDREFARVGSQAVRTKVRYGVRRALAYAVAGEVDHACTLTRDLLGGAITVSSATIAADLRSLARVLNRHPRNAQVRDLSPELSTALRIVTP
ncbi:transcriptional regulator [Sphaerisporangium rufum]|uniref:Transcriptional regulator n=1 Tax=Sphaerisporangium rufum TaxID=1381558 RepID=A0A919UYC1_9ACTN|nr:helix-turn-helix transcriptional regulator [Sphaerisporangium rufum]GII76694.1 transcriptional regulator [Sphaerisporangium rufum]